MSEPTKNLASAVIAVMSEVGTLMKDGHNDFSNYSFTTEAMVVNTLRPLLVKNGLAFIPHNISVTSELQIHEKMRRVAISATYLLMHSSGESLTVTVPGEGMDSLDKASAKCLTAAYKYALLQTFCVGRGDDGDHGQGYSEGKPQSMPERTHVPYIQPSPRQDDGGYVFEFGKHKGKSIRDTDLAYLKWLLESTQAQINDPEKAKFKIKNKKMIDLILDEINRRGKNSLPEILEEDIPF